MVVGILALQGGFALHQEKFHSLGIETKLISRPDAMKSVSGIVVPGGESSTMLKNASGDLWEQLKTFAKSAPIWGICAGAILLATRVENPTQPSLGIIDIDIIRNAYGSQNESFIVNVHLEFNHERMNECIFIRAPKIVRTGHHVKILGNHADTPIMVEQNQHIATTFHPELGSGTEVHEYFLQKIRQN